VTHGHEQDRRQVLEALAGLDLEQEPKMRGIGGVEPLEDVATSAAVRTKETATRSACAATNG